MNNKKLGTRFEKRVCEYLASECYWAHFITPDNRGAQPFDIIAVRNGVAVAVECKTLSDTRNYFPISRLEDNQIMAFKKWRACGNALIYIAIEWQDKMYMVSYTDLEHFGKIDMRLLEAL